MTTAAPAPAEPTLDDLDVPSVAARHFGLAVLALAMGGFAIGTTEFVTMGLLPQIAGGVDVSIPTGGHVISAYAVGVVVGAPVLAFLGARLPRRALLVALMAAFAVGNGVSALATSYEQLMVARFAAGLPHGAYFGVASLVAASMARPSRKGRAVSQVMLGLSVANVLGVPAATVLGQELGWRAAFWAASGLAVLVVDTRAPHRHADGEYAARRDGGRAAGAAPRRPRRTACDRGRDRGAQGDRRPLRHAGRRRVALMERQRQLVAELVEALWARGVDALDPVFVEDWELACDDAGRRRVVIDQVASLTDASAVARHAALA
jgi:MFS family permease